MRRILLAFIFTVASAGLALAAVENIKVSGDITVQGVTRDISLGNQEVDLDFGQSRDSEDFILSQVRLRFDADLTENVSAVVQLLNERVWDLEDDELDPYIMGANVGDWSQPGDTDVALDLGYFTMKDMFDYPMTLTIGRQPLRFGKGLIIGDPDSATVFVPGAALVVPAAPSIVVLSANDTYVAADGLKYIADDLSLKKSFDAIRTTLDYSPLVIDLVYAKTLEGATNMDDDVTLTGANVSYELDENTQLEGYVWAKIQDESPALNLLGISPEGPEDKNDRVFTLGIRGETAITDQLSLFGEYAYQFGDYVNVWNAAPADLHAERDAFAVQLGGAFQFEDDNNSAVSLTYTYLSGDDDPENNKWEQWDPMYEDQRCGEILQLFLNTGIQGIKLSGSTMPREDLTAILDVYWCTLTESTLPTLYDPAANPGSNVLVYATGPLRDQWYWIDRDEKDLGWEVDASLIYDYTEDVQMGLISAWFFPGDFFADQNDETAYQVRAYARVDF